jgi:hypothetical protein
MRRSVAIPVCAIVALLIGGTAEAPSTSTLTRVKRLERRVNALAVLEASGVTTRTDFQPMTAQGNGYYTAAVSCPSGRLTGGGVEINGGSNGTVVNDHPSQDGRFWVGQVYVQSPSLLPTAYVVCAT